MLGSAGGDGTELMILVNNYCYLRWQSFFSKGVKKEWEGWVELMNHRIAWEHAVNSRRCRVVLMIL